MWPWSRQTELLALLSDDEERKEEGSDREKNTDNEARPFELRGPVGGGNNNRSRRAGAYDVAAGLEVEGELLDKAIDKVEWLTVFWYDGGNPATRSSTPFPKWIFRLKGLRGLNLERYPHETLPEEIGSLTSLEHFHCCGSNLKRLPRSMGRLQNLIELDCYTSYNLHYLPYEISKCRNLRSSRFSTRALYNNCKNRMPLPPLQPWWNGGEECQQQANTPDFVRSILAQATIPGNDEDSISAERQCKKELFPPMFSDQRIMPLLCWDTCSVCERPYEFDKALHVWSHQRIATDAQALLAFCCSMKCASSILNQVYFDPAEQPKNRRLKSDFPAWSREFTNDAVKTWTGLISKHDIRRRHPTYEVWIEEHLGSRNAMIDGMQLSMSSTSETRNSLSRPPNGNSRRRFLMKVLASGDVRQHPDSSSYSLGRLSERSVVLIDGTTSNKGRQWVRLCKISDHSEWGWTALRKKYGTLKLVSLNVGDTERISSLHDIC